MVEEIWEEGRSRETADSERLGRDIRGYAVPRAHVWVGVRVRVVLGLFSFHPFRVNISAYCAPTKGSSVCVSGLSFRASNEGERGEGRREVGHPASSFHFIFSSLASFLYPKVVKKAGVVAVGSFFWIVGLGVFFFGPTPIGLHRGVPSIVVFQWLSWCYPLPFSLSSCHLFFS